MAKDVRVKFTADTKGIEKVDKEFDKFSTKAKKGTKGVNKEFKNLDKEAGLLSESMTKAGAAFTAFFGVNLIKDVVTGLAGVNKELLEIGVRAQGVQTAFGNVSGANIEELRASVKGTVSDLTLMASTVKADKFGIPIQKMGGLLKFAAQSAKDTGEEVEVLAEKISTAIGRKSLLILDDFGITATQVKKALGGMSAEAATVEQLTEAVLKIAEGQMQNYNSTLDAADAYNKLISTVQNLKMAGGDLLLQDKEIVEELTKLTDLIKNNGPEVLRHITDWGRGALKLANTVGSLYEGWFKFIGLLDDTEELTIGQQLEQQKETVKELRAEWKKANDERDAAILKIEEAEKNSVVINKGLTIQKQNERVAEAKGILDNAKLKLDSLKKQEFGEKLINKRVEERKRLEEESLKTKDKIVLGDKERLKLAKELAQLEKEMLGYQKAQAKIDAEVAKETGIYQDRTTNTNYTAREAGSLSEDQEYQKELNAKRLELITYEWNNAKTKRELEERALQDKIKAEEEQRQFILSVTTQSLNALTSIHSIWADTSLNMFGKLAGALGAGSGIIDAFLPGIGSLIGAGAGLASALFGQADEETSSSSSIDSELSAVSTSSKASSTITQQKQNITNNNYTTIQAGTVVADDPSLEIFVERIEPFFRQLNASMA